MILTGNTIAKEVASGKIEISDFNHNRVNPNSYNFTLGEVLMEYSDSTLDARSEPPTRSFVIPASGYRLRAQNLYLAHTAETMGSDHYVPTFAARSSVARLGLFIHASSGLGDIGFHGQWTLQLVPTVDVIVYPGMEIGQIMFWRVSGQINLYKGKYAGSRGPCASKMYMNLGQLGASNG